MGGGFAFPRASRLPAKRAFDHVFRRPVRSADAAFTVLARRNGLNGPRLGLAVSRKTSRLAHRRNRLKRLVRESFRHAAAELLPPADIVVITKPEANTTPSPQLRASLDRHWQRIAQRCNG